VPDVSPDRERPEAWLGLNLLTLAWAFANATLFVIVPDVLITAVALRNGRRAVTACGYALAGTLLGGVLMWNWGAHDPLGAAHALDRLPGVSWGMIHDAADEIERNPEHALWHAVLTGTPFKVEAMLAGGSGLYEDDKRPFVLESVMVLLPRYVALALAAAFLSNTLGRNVSPRRKQAVHLAVWAAFYAGYFIVMPN
jgi:membrane protein YqaA with SNARE-associated domain